MTNHTILTYNERVIDAYMRGDFPTAIKLQYLSTVRPVKQDRPFMCESAITDCLDDDDVIVGEER
jgi:hypothetical protein